MSENPLTRRVGIHRSRKAQRFCRPNRGPSRAFILRHQNRSNVRSEVSDWCRPFWFLVIFEQIIPQTCRKSPFTLSWFTLCPSSLCRFGCDALSLLLRQLCCPCVTAL